MTLVLLDEDILAADLGWRLCFGIGALLGLGILLVRRHVPESPRWLFIHGHADDADRVVGEIERTIVDETGRDLPQPERDPIEIRQRRSTSFVEIARTMVKAYPRRSVLGLGPVLLGHLFDTVGRKVMITISYVGSGLLLIGTAALLSSGAFGAWTLTLAWCAIFSWPRPGRARPT
jgi:MFS family permease